MKPERLQEIKSRYDKTSRIDAYIKKDVNDLAAALEAAQAEAVHEKQCTDHLMTSPNDRWDELEEWLDKAGYINQSFLVRCNEERAEIRVQLVKAQAEIERLLKIRNMRKNRCPECIDQTWLTVIKTGNIRCDYCGYEYDGRKA